MLNNTVYDKTVLIYNEKSGGGNSLYWSKIAKQTLLLAKFKNVLLMSLMEFEKNHNFLEDSNESKSLVIIAGGDGTINSVVKIVLGFSFNVKLGIIPCGTVNNFAIALKIPLQPERAIQKIIFGSEKNVDVGKVGDRYMISSLTIGVLADIASKVKQKDKREFGFLAYIKNAINILGKNRISKIRIKYDAGKITQKTQFVLVLLSNSVAGIDYFNPKAAIDDGYFHVYILKKTGILSLLWILPSILTGNFLKLREVIYFKSKKLLISQYNKRRTRTRIDGEPSQQLPVNMDVQKMRLTVVS